MNHHETPLFTGVTNHAKKNPIQFHIPGHKKGAGMNPDFREFIGENALSIDLINIGPLDDLHHPKGMIKEAQELAADAFGADYTFFNVQGTSGAIMTMILSVCSPGDKIIIPRNVHKSISTAIILAGAIPVFIHPVMDKRLGIAHGITTSAVRTALEQNPDAKAVLVINPTYFGVAANLKEIVEVAHSFSVPVLVDEAHGVHIHFHQDLPMSAMEAGADMAATSVHKLGGSMTQSSVLNVRGKLISPKRIQTVMSMLTTTSTSYLLLSSLDVARKQLVLHGKEMVSTAIELADWARSEINLLAPLYCMGDEIVGRDESTFDLDPTKLLIHVRDLGMTGFEVENWLRDTQNIEVEMSDLYNILCLVTPGDTKDSVNSLVQALKQLVEYAARQDSSHVNGPEIELPKIPRLAMTPRDAFYAETELVPFHQSHGRIIAEFIMVYPPGIPVLLPGEIITQENLDYIQYNLEVGLPVQGPEDFDFRYLRVIKVHQAIT
ncbi:aminotransferase class I/II-fold pyridoxal phosphate-dependent enzyme [Bacillus horti]|uniref:aminotransferase class I/II-fold pyridoxal phosphate-dependent enzyme n=1 Tax=Caldalkalibacillus horti TaxID=77523 RepID=UPI0027D85DE5|nr:aminotransferase class I/II-fold pyridoxal phosphate-dependent enzyme [Bacillus horti]